jgi:hypothetical protein
MPRPVHKGQTRRRPPCQCILGRPQCRRCSRSQKLAGDKASSRRCSWSVQRLSASASLPLALWDRRCRTPPQGPGGRGPAQVPNVESRFLLLPATSPVKGALASPDTGGPRRHPLDGAQWADQTDLGGGRSRRVPVRLQPGHLSGNRRGSAGRAMNQRAGRRGRDGAIPPGPSTLWSRKGAMEGESSRTKEKRLCPTCSIWVTS